MACVDREQRRPVLVLDDGQPRGGAGLRHGVGGDREQGLAVVFHQAVGEHGIVAGERAHVVDAGDFLGRQHDDDARRGAHLRHVELLTAACARSLMAM